MLRFSRALGAAAALAVLGGCGGGDSAGSQPPATFTVSAKVDAASVAGLALTPGTSGSVSVSDGHHVEIDSTSAVTFTPVPSSSTVTAATSTATSWSADVSSFSGGTVALQVALAADPSKTATVTIDVAAHRFAKVARLVNDEVDWAEVDTFTAIPNVTRNYPVKVVAVNADGSSSVTTLGGGFDETRTLDIDGNAVTRLFNANGNLCTFTPKRDYFHYPMYVGQTWSSTFSYSCTLGYHESSAITATVEAYENVTVPAGTFQALRLKRVTSYTNSNDANLSNGAAGMAAFQIALTSWWDTASGREVKVNSAYTYVGTAPANYLQTIAMDATYVGNR